MNANKLARHYEEKIESLQSLLISQQAELTHYQQRCEQYSNAYASLQHQLKELLRHRFGRKSEKFIDDAQLSLFDAPTPYVSPNQAAEPEKGIITYERKKTNRTYAKLNCSSG